MSEQNQPAVLDRPLTLLHKMLLMLIVAVPFLSVFVAVWQMWSLEIAPYLAQGFVLYLFIAAGVTVGLHRYFTHGSFQATPSVKFVLALLASLALEGPIVQWVANHMRHHELSDQEGDLHSPVVNSFRNLEPDSYKGMFLGFCFAHVGWLFSDKAANPHKYAKRLMNDRIVIWFSRNFPWFILITFLLPALLGIGIALLLGQSFLFGAWEGFLWGGLVRIALVHHVTWSVNSICHVFGEHIYDTGEFDQSRNVAWLALPTLGESWHNSHHALQWSAMHGSAWWNDPSFAVILVLEKLGLVSDVRVPTKQQKQNKLLPEKIA